MPICEIWFFKESQNTSNTKKCCLDQEWQDLAHLSQTRPNPICISYILHPFEWINIQLSM